MKRPTFCIECDNVVEESRKRLPTQWLCRMQPRLEGQGFVAPHVWVEMEPFMRCSGCNGGACPMFIERRVTERTKSEPTHTEGS